MTLPALDPVPVWLLRLGLAALLLAAAGHKLRDLAGFRAVLADYRLLPRAAVPGVAVLLAALELGLGLALLAPATASEAALGAAALLAAYAGAIGANLARGRRAIDCGCLGPAARTPLHGGLLARNALLVGAALVSAAPTAPRAVELLDAVTLAAGLVFVALLWSAAAGLLAQAARARVRA